MKNRNFLVTAFFSLGSILIFHLIEGKPYFPSDQRELYGVWRCREGWPEAIMEIQNGKVNFKNMPNSNVIQHTTKFEILQTYGPGGRPCITCESMPESIVFVAYIEKSLFGDLTLLYNLDLQKGHKMEFIRSQ